MKETIYLRIPPVLKKAIENAAAAERISVNQWVELKLWSAVANQQTSDGAVA